MSSGSGTPAHMPNPRYYTRHSAEKKRASKKANQTDGCSMYRSLARQLIGDPREFQKLRDAVQVFTIRVRSNNEDLLHGEYLSRESSHEATTAQPLFTSLDCPDMYPTEDLLWVISQALKVKITIYASITAGEVDDVFATSGAQTSYPCVLLREPCVGVIQHQFSSLLPDESGKELIEYLQATHDLIESEAESPVHQQTFKGARLMQMSWGFALTTIGDYCYVKQGDVKCFNEHRPESSIQDLDGTNPERRMDHFVLVVSEPEQLKAALDLFKNALGKAPNQHRQVRVGPSCRPGILKPHVAQDLEFVKVPREKANNLSRDTADRMIAKGELEELCSVSTTAIDKFLSLHVNVLHMLENPTEHTVPALQQYFEEIIFNPDVTKLWWNYQSDFHVLDNTIAHLFQGTPRGPYWYSPYQGRPRWVERTFRISSPFFNGERPKSLELPKEHDGCDMHMKGKNGLEMACPCPLGNIDIAPLLGHMGRQIGLPVDKGPWTQHRHGVNYGKLLQMMLPEDRHYHIFNYMKTCHSLGPDAADFYQKLGKPGMEKNDFAMAYNIGDVLGINVIWNTLACDDARFVAGQLASYAKNAFVPRQSQPRRSSFNAVGGILLFEEYPRLFKREAVWTEEQDWLSSALETSRQVSRPGRRMLDKNVDEDFGFESISERSGNPFFDDRLSSKYDPAVWTQPGLRPWEHDRCAQFGRDIVNQTPLHEAPAQHSVYDSLSSGARKIVVRRGHMALVQGTDPAFIWLPETCAEIPPENRPDPVIRSNMTHAEALIEFLGTSHATNASPPPGFGAAPGTPFGLPAHLNRVPGGALPHARDIFHAFQTPAPASTITSNLLGPRSPPNHLEPAPVPSPQGCANAAVSRALEYFETDDKWSVVKYIRESLQKVVPLEKSTNDLYGLPGPIDFNDVWDPYGRAYRAAVEATPEWNRPVLKGMPKTGRNGEWISIATLTLQGLAEMVDPAGLGINGEWDVVVQKRKTKNAW